MNNMNHMNKNSHSKYESKYKSRPMERGGKIAWTREEEETWEILINRQTPLVKTRATQSFLDGLDCLRLVNSSIPHIPSLNKRLKKETGFQVSPVKAIIGAEEFFTLLANKKFPVATFIRSREELDYLQEPDIFHELFGHTPLLAMSAYASFMEQFGKLALRCPKEKRKQLFRLFWFTVEFGLIQEQNSFKIYGGGILSSIGEVQYALSSKPVVKKFDLLDILRTPYRIDIMQPLYYYIKDFSTLFSILNQNILETLEKAILLGDHAAIFDKKLLTIAS